MVPLLLLILRIQMALLVLPLVVVTSGSVGGDGDCRTRAPRQGLLVTAEQSTIETIFLLYLEEAFIIKQLPH